jgi:hypothetical protein
LPKQAARLLAKARDSPSVIGGDVFSMAFTIIIPLVKAYCVCIEVLFVYCTLNLGYNISIDDECVNERVTSLVDGISILKTDKRSWGICKALLRSSLLPI